MADGVHGFYLLLAHLTASSYLSSYDGPDEPSRGAERALLKGLEGAGGGKKLPGNRREPRSYSTSPVNAAM